MNAITFDVAPGASRVDRYGRWRRRVVDHADIPGVLVCAVPLLLGIFLSTGVRAAELAIYALCTLAVLPFVGPFMTSTRRHGANAVLLLVFVVLGVATVAASQQDASDGAVQVKALAALAVWASIYIVAFAAVQTPSGVARFTRWIHWTCIAISASVYLSAILHLLGIRFGEVLEFRDGSFRAFGPLGDQVAFIVVLPALISLAESRPLRFGVHLGALLLTATRGALLSLSIGLVAYVLLLASSRTRTRSLKWGIASIAVAAAIAVSPLSSVITERVVSAPTNESYSFRWTAITSGVQLVREHPLLGVGFNGFAGRRRAVAEDWLGTAAAENGLSRAANQFVQTATDGGIFAGLGLVLFVALTLKNAYRAIRWKGANGELTGVQLWLIAVLIGNQGALWFLADASSGFFILAIAALAARVNALSHAPNHAGVV